MFTGTAFAPVNGRARGLRGGPMKPRPPGLGLVAGPSFMARSYQLHCRVVWFAGLRASMVWKLHGPSNMASYVITGFAAQGFLWLFHCVAAS